MSDDHLTPELLEAVLGGSVSPQELIRRVAGHLVSVCPDCREGYAAFSRRCQRPSFSVSPSLLLAALEIFNRRLIEELSSAEKELAILLELPLERRRPRVQRAVRKFRSPLLADLLLAESLRRVFSDPAEAAQLAEIALDVTLRLSVGASDLELLQELVLRALAHKGNALRAGGDLRAADETLSLAARKLNEVPEPSTRAEILSFVASLRRAQRRLPEAIAAIDRVIAIHLRTGDRRLLAESRIKRAQILREEGDAERAILEVGEALPLLEGDDNPRLQLCARHDLACYLTEVGRFTDARRLMAATEDLYARFPEPWTQLRRRWVAAKVAQGLGEKERAESELVAVRDGFADLGSSYDAALVSLDLALLYSEGGRTLEMRRLGEEMVPLFAARDIHREALAALLVFCDATHREEATTALVTSLRRYLERARSNPDLRFEGED